MRIQSSIFSGVALAAALGSFAVQAQQAPAAVAAAAGPMRVLVNPGDTGEVSRVALYGAWKGALEQALRKEDIKSAHVALSADATADLAATRSRIHDIFVAPAHVIGSAVRYGYVPVL